MKVSLGTSLVAHTLVLGWALVSLSTPTSLTVADVEALPVDIVPIESLTQMQQGDKKAPLSEKPSPKPTNNKKVVDRAENAGENNVDLKSPPTPTTKPVQTEVAAAPKPVERPVPTPTPEQNTVKDIAPEETAPKPVPAAAVPIPKPEPTPPKPEPTPPKPEPTPPKPEAAKPTPAPVKTENTSETAELPPSVPTPVSKPQPPKPEPPKEQAKPAEKPAEKPVEKKPDTPKPTETAKAADAKATDSAKPTDKKDGKKQETAKASSSKSSDFNADQIASLLNKQDASGGGAKRSSMPASTGSVKPSNGAKLSQNEMDALRGQIQKNWSVIAGIEGATGMIIKVTMKLDQSGQIIGEPEVSASGGSDNARRTLQASALRAVRRSAPFKNLPADKYDAWSEVVVNFDPSELL